MGRQIDVEDLVDAPIIAERLGLAGLSVVRDRIRRHENFPSAAGALQQVRSVGVARGGGLGPGDTAALTS